MMKKKTGNRHAITRQLVVLPLLALLVMGLANREVKTVTNPFEKEVENRLLTNKPGDQNNIGPVESNQVSQFKVKGKVTDDKGEPVSSVAVILKGATTGTITDSKGNYMITVSQQDETLIFSMTGYEKQEVEISGLTEIDVTLHPDNNLVKAESKITGKKNEEVAQEEIIIRKAENKITGRKNEEVAQEKIIGRKTGDFTQPLFVVNGVIMETIDHISPDRIKSISVLKNESATALYGENGKDGAVVIALKGQLIPEDYPAAGKPLILVNGIATSANINEINPEDIKSIDVYKGESALTMYGDLARNGAIVITLKEKTSENTLITNPMHLRRHIAGEIKYPAAAQQAGQQGRIILYAEFDKDGKITRISETGPESSPEILDEVVIIGYQPDTPGQPTNETLKLLTEESKRVMRSFPKIDIPEFRGKWVKMQLNFVLQ